MSDPLNFAPTAVHEPSLPSSLSPSLSLTWNWPCSWLEFGLALELSRKVEWSNCHLQDASPLRGAFSLSVHEVLLPAILVTGPLPAWAALEKCHPPEMLCE